MTNVAERDWNDLTPDERMDVRFANWLNVDVPFVSPEAREAYRARAQRLMDAARLKKTPDRVPYPFLVAEVYPATRAGLLPYDAMYDFDRASKAFIDFNVDFEPDAMVPPVAGCLPGKVYDILDYRLYSWPGHGAPKEATYQFNEGDWMKLEDYDAFLADPMDFMFRQYLPRISGAFEGMAKLGSCLDPAVMVFSAGYIASWGQPEVRASVERLLAAGEQAAAWFGKVGAAIGQLMSMGFPPYFALGTQAPFDYLGDDLRGTRQIAMDLYRCPEKVLAACDALVPLMIRWVTEKANPYSPPLVFWPLHKGADGFMSLEQFKTFYWPGVLKVINGLVEEGFMPVLFAEGRYESRLETIAADLPPGKTIWHFDRTDMGRAKETIGKVAAIQGNVPLSLLQMGTPEEVTEYCRTLIEVAAPGGGFLIDAGAVIHQANDDNLRAMIQAAKTYGVY